MIGPCKICGRLTARAPLCELHEGFGTLGGLILAGKVNEFFDEETGDLSVFDYTDFQKAPELAAKDAKETLTIQLSVIMSVHAWRLDEPWGTLPGDDREGAAA